MESGPVLGVNFGTHDSAAAVVHEGEVLVAIEEERLSREKHTKVFPARAIAACLAQAGVEVQDLRQLALFVDPKLQLLLPATNLYHGFPLSLGSLRSDIDKYWKRRSLLDVLRDSELLPSCTVVPVAHHRAHAAGAYLTSPFDDALVVTLDGRGEFETACAFDGRDGRLRLRHRIVYPHSFGYLYSMLTRYLGFRPQRDEYKVMGLAAYGGPDLVERMSRLATFDGRSGRLRLNLRFFDHHRRPSAERQLYSRRLVDLLGPPRRPDEEITDRHKAVAFAAQGLLEWLITRYLSFLGRRLPHRNLCLAGGVALNCVANGRIIESGRFDAVYVQPAAGDPGASIGAALLAERARRSVRHHTAIRSALLGPSYDRASIRRALDELSPDSHQIRETRAPHQEAAQLLDRNQVIGWFSGRMEFGPRALGARSILASARSELMPARINAHIKRRELFRPLAPAVQVEHAHDYFELNPAGTAVYPYMLATAAVRPGRRATIPAVVHVDGSARVQTVDRTTSPDLWTVIQAYRELTGIPVVLNTSFNHAEEPIVCTPDDAVRSYLRCELDALVIGSFVVTREPAW